ncbi:MAG: Gfo/Idh/MocA family oxidoreductase [Fimbriimonadaceae bacterium]|nr:Gfo/Idh/MocA family oxidoreductase [Fimbriimonadaceae bacterium]MCE2767096.1 Gfo/Idh/MocA family oxidoreductase [Fimbriimonadaceae bacterium]
MLKVGVVGCGFMGKMHSSVYAMLPNAEFVGVYDVSEERGKPVAEKHGVAFFSDFEAFAASVDAIDICLPTYLHAEYTVKAAELKKHVLCEKPMALTTADAEKMVAACRENDVRLMIAHCIRFWPEYALLKKLTVEGQLGALVSLNLTRYGEFPSWSSNDWLSNEELTGGAALDMHIHDTDYALYLLGKPLEVFSAGTYDDKGLSHIFSTFVYSNTVVHLEGGWNLPPGAPFKMAFRAVFENGAAIWDGGPMTVYEKGKDPVVPEFPKMSTAGGGNISDLGGYYHEIKHFVDRVLSGEEFDVSTPESSLDSLTVALEEIRLAKSRR